MTSGLRFKVPDSGQDSLWEDRVVLDEVFWKALRDHPVPLLRARESLRARARGMPEFLDQYAPAREEHPFNRLNLRRLCLETRAGA